MYPHRIRLRGPWDYQTSNSDGRITMPATLRDLSLPSIEGVRFLRRFGHPRQLDDFERVWLVCDGLEGVAEFTLNEQPLGTFTSAFTHELTSPLLARNLLQVDLTPANEDAGLWGEVALEIRRTAYLHDLARQPDGSRMRITGRVVGVCDGPLDLYVLCDGTTVHHQMIRPGDAFDVNANHGSPRIELIQGANVWYVAEL